MEIADCLLAVKTSFPEIEKETIERVKTEVKLSCLALCLATAKVLPNKKTVPIALVTAYMHFSHANRTGGGFSDIPNWDKLTHEQQQEIRVKRVSEFFVELKTTLDKHAANQA